MKFLKNHSWIMIAITAIIFLTTCKKDNPNFKTESWIGPPDNGTLHVIVQNGPTSYVQGAIVNLFLTGTDRQNGVVYATQNTVDHGGSADTGIYATFTALPYQKYYIQATANVGGVNSTGTENSGTGLWVAKGMVTTILVNIY